MKIIGYGHRILWVLVLLFLVSRLSFPCTSIIVTKGASADGSVIITYSCDGEFLPRLRLYPAADHGVGEKAEIMGFRGKRGEIPEVAHTYKVLDLMNEFQGPSARRPLTVAWSLSTRLACSITLS
ncbi:MAG: hypothetical protein ABSG73_12760 [Candidatus Aminicenantales bacterium]|jgi:hypothetical protein